MHMLYHRQPRKVIQALAGHRDPRSMEVYTRVFALDMAATLAVPFTGDGRDAYDPAYTASPEMAYALPYISCGQQNRHNISWSMYISCSE